MTTESAQTPANKAAEVVVVGGGLAGLAAALYVGRSGRSVELLERKGRLGGLAVTDDRDGFQFNQGPHALYASSAGADVLNDLGVKMAGGKPPAKGRLVINGSAELLPGGLPSLVRTGALSAAEKVQIAGQLARLPKLKPEAFATTSVTDWINGAVSGNNARALLHGLTRLVTYVNNPDELSADVTIEQLQHGLGPGVLYLNGGWQTLVNQMASKLEAMANVTIATNANVDQLPDAPAVIVAGGGPSLATRLTGHQFDVGPAAEASCLDLGLRSSPTHDFVLGADEPFYFSNHSAVADLAPVGQCYATSVQYLTPGGEPSPDAIEAFTRHAGVSQSDVVASRRMHRMTAVTSIPTASRGGLAGRPDVTVPGCTGVYVSGDWVGPSGHLADASLASARQASRAALAQLERVGAATA